MYVEGVIPAGDVAGHYGPIIGFPDLPRWGMRTDITPTAHLQRYDVRLEHYNVNIVGMFGSGPIPRVRPELRNRWWPIDEWEDGTSDMRTAIELALIRARLFPAARAKPKAKPKPKPAGKSRARGGAAKGAGKSRSTLTPGVAPRQWVRRWAATQGNEDSAMSSGSRPESGLS